MTSCMPAPAMPSQGNLNPQTSAANAPTINAVLVTTDNNFNLSTFSLGLQTFQGGTVNYFPPTTQTPTSTSSNTAQVNGLPSQNGVNAYSALNFPTSDWWELIPGSNVIAPTGRGTTGVAGTWQIDHRDAWL